MPFDFCGDQRIIVFKKYFVEIGCLSKIMAKLPFDDPCLIATEVTNPDHWSLCFNRSLRYFFNKFPALIPPFAIVDSIIEQFTSMHRFERMKMFIVMWINGGFVQLCGCGSLLGLYSCVGVDQWWVEIGRKHQQMQFLSQVMCSIRCLPHSSAHCKKISHQ